MIFRRSFTVDAPLEAVRRFHLDPAGVVQMTPPPVRVWIQQAPPQIREGETMSFILWFGPLPVRWLARFEEVTQAGFTDRQLRGPFRRWVHHHSFVPVDGVTTVVRDEIEVALRRHPFWGLFGLFMWLSLPVLFAYRERRTRRLVK